MQQISLSRQLIILRGANTSLLLHPTYLKQYLAGDWIIVSADLLAIEDHDLWINPTKTKNLLGREFKHAIFDATKSFNLDAFNILSGTLTQGSMLILLLPDTFSSWQDLDSLRWHESSTPIEVPNFANHLLNTIQKYTQIISNVIYKNAPNSITDLVYLLKNHCVEDEQLSSNLTDEILYEQQQVLTALTYSSAKINIVTAKRGRGKSALAGLFTHNKICWISAPNRAACHTLFKFSTHAPDFFAPDELIQLLQTKQVQYPEWLIIDEAAMISMPLLQQIIGAMLPYCRILLTTTVEGYEGTGQGFLLKLLQDEQVIAESVSYFTLQQPIRWQLDDTLEQFTEELNGEGLYPAFISQNNIGLPMIMPILQHDLPTLLTLYQMLKSAHYRTTLTDLRRLLDAHNLVIHGAKSQQNELVGGLVSILEGGLDDDLIDEIWAGTRRPKGNLVAQSLVAHAGEKQAARLRSLRINRVAIIEHYRRQGIAKQLINAQIDYAKLHQLDFLSVSFAFTPEMNSFWQACGFTLIHIGSRRESSSGSYAAMSILPISQSGKQLMLTLRNKLVRDWYWLKNLVDIKLSFTPDSDNESLSLNKLDWLALKGFSLNHRPYEASYPALCRLAYHIDIQDYPLLNALVKNNHSVQQVVMQFALTGKQQLQNALRQEVKQCCLLELEKEHNFDQ